jgi:hypothetical protein
LLRSIVLDEINTRVGNWLSVGRHCCGFIGLMC